MSGNQGEQGGFRRQVGLSVGFPEIITLCGSTRFKEDYERAMRDLSLRGHLVISVGLFGHQEGLDMEGPTKKMLDELHLRKIDLADSIFVVNGRRKHCGNCNKFVEPLNTWKTECPFCWGPLTALPYVGESTRREIAYAQSRGKTVQYLYEEGT